MALRFSVQGSDRQHTFGAHIGVGTVLEDNVGTLDVAACGRIHERGVALGRCAINVGAVLEERHHHVQMPFLLHSRVQRRDACASSCRPSRDQTIAREAREDGLSSAW